MVKGHRVAASIWVILGSALGGLARYWLAAWVTALTGPSFPWGTLLINVLGSFVIGLFAAALGDRGLFSAALVPNGQLAGFVDLRAFVMVGLCGGFTTYSAFGYETFQLMRNGQAAAAFGSIALQLLLGLAAVWAGAAIARGAWN